MKKMLFLLVVASQIYTHDTDQDQYIFELITGQKLQTVVPFMVEQRVAIFSGYPYFEGDTVAQKEYVQWFAELPGVVAAVAYYNGLPVGFVTGIGFIELEPHFVGSSQLFQDNGLDPKDFYYVPEAMITAEHRGKLLFQELHDLIERHARGLGYKASCLLEESHEQHPLKPANYKGPEGAFVKAGYRKTQMFIPCSWATFQPDGSVSNQEHILRYWITLF
ncbi:MAG TPA: hypothetical protein VGT41_02650 [Candidatus Babeliales bacterium]|nr:hypothetical protein [Candidatus Babeliales bacterium]